MVLSSLNSFLIRTTCFVIQICIYSVVNCFPLDWALSCLTHPTLCLISSSCSTFAWVPTEQKQYGKILADRLLKNLWLFPCFVFKLLSCILLDLRSGRSSAELEREHWAARCWNTELNKPKWKWQSSQPLITYPDWMESESEKDPLSHFLLWNGPLLQGLLD